MSKQITPGCKVKCIRGHEPLLHMDGVYTVVAFLKWIYLGTTGHTLTMVSSEKDGGTLGGIGGWFNQTTEMVYSVTFKQPQIILLEQGQWSQGPQFLLDADRFEVVE